MNLRCWHWNAESCKKGGCFSSTTKDKYVVVGKFLDCFPGALIVGTILSLFARSTLIRVRRSAKYNDHFVSFENSGREVCSVSDLKSARSSE